MQIASDNALTPPGPRAAAPREAELRRQSEKLEAAFLAEMLQYAGLGESEGAFSGGPGEAQFSSFLRQEQADAMVAKGGVGLAEQIFQSLMSRERANG